MLGGLHGKALVSVKIRRTMRWKCFIFKKIHMQPEEIQSRILYRDGLILILDKPAGIAVHAGPGKGASLEDDFEHLRFGLPTPPFLAHRLDRDTSGCLVLGRHKKALRRLHQLFSEGLAQKTYWAMVSNQPPAAEGTINAPLHKISSKAKGWRMVVDELGKEAVTDYALKGQSAMGYWLELKPRTGRTHQIRVHLAHIGCPILGDVQYGGQAHPDGMHLHARQISLPLYPKRDPVTAVADVPWKNFAKNFESERR
jgi:tRNA pseudouridine32 synthase/23S rRNA pseudouridine746 synthase/23S rRNA pseudouridine1911/1915/1917 synthase